MSSRICVKNLPRYLTEERLREHFSQVGEVTDAKIMRTQEGKSRQFGFIGYRTEKEAEAAVKYFKDTYLDTCKLICEVAYKIGDSNVPRPWSRYSQPKQENVNKDVKDRDSSLLKSSKKENLKQIQKTSTADKDDPLLEEFLQVMQPRNKTKLWANDTILGPKNGYDLKPGQGDGQIGERKKKIDVEMVEGVLRKVPVGKGRSSEKLKRVHVRFDDESEEDTEGEDFLENQNIIVDSFDEADKTPDMSQSINLAKDESVSDMEYFKSRVKHSWDDENNSGEQQSTEEEMDHESCEEGSADENEDNEGSINKGFVDVPDSKQPLDQCMPDVQLKDLKTDNNNNSSEGKVTDTRREVQNMNGNEIDQNGASSIEGLDELESAVETGRLFIRNLPFTTSEDDLVELFSKYGEISQVHLVLDRLTKQSKGYAYVLYMLPESALRALENLDKSIFQGRLLHVMPARKPPPAQKKHKLMAPKHLE